MVRLFAPRLGFASDSDGVFTCTYLYKEFALLAFPQVKVGRIVWCYPNWEADGVGQIITDLGNCEDGDHYVTVRMADGSDIALPTFALNNWDEPIGPNWFHQPLPADQIMQLAEVELSYPQEMENNLCR
jgi:hypothetical protein